jgi:hypothetical protein
MSFGLNARRLAIVPGLGCRSHLGLEPGLCKRYARLPHATASWSMQSISYLGQRRERHHAGVRDCNSSRMRLEEDDGCSLHPLKAAKVFPRRS